MLSTLEADWPDFIIWARESIESKKILILLIQGLTLHPISLQRSKDEEDFHGFEKGKDFG